MDPTPRRTWAWVVLAIALLVFAPACLGPNHAVGHVAKWNLEFEGKWAQEGMFLVLFPVYVIFSVGDLLIFNSWQWWTGVNPISRVSPITAPNL